jgi:hypothetical protein
MAEMTDLPKEKAPILMKCATSARFSARIVSRLPGRMVETP